MYFKDLLLAAHMKLADVVVFDMNGTIVDDEPVQLRASNDVMNRFGIDLTEDDFIKHCVGRKPREWMSEMLPQVRDLQLEWLMAEREDAYARRVAAVVKDLARPGAVDMIKSVAAHPEKKLALATSSSSHNAGVILGPSGLNVMHLFDFVITGAEVKQGKPHPEIYDRVRKAFPAARSFLVIEDTQQGVTAAKASRMTCLAFPNRFTAGQDFSAADLVVNSLLPESVPPAHPRLTGRKFVL